MTHSAAALSTATEHDGDIQVAVGTPVQIERGADGLCTDAPAMAATSGASGARTARLVEDLENETWTGAVSEKN